MRKQLAILSHNSEVPMSGQCNIMSLIDRFQDIITFGIVRYRQM